jgi:hypothetical protein
LDALAYTNALGDGEEGYNGRSWRYVWRNPGKRGDNEKQIVVGAGDVADAGNVAVDRVAGGAGRREVVEGDLEPVAEQLDEANAT